LRGGKAEIVEVIREMGSAGIVEIANATEMDKGNVYRICSELCGRGQLKKKGYGKGNVRYSLIENETGEEDVVV
jgi:DNA-binding IclR family transcriptional regulator